MYKFLGVGLLGIFAMLAVPAVQQQDTQTTYMGGMATMVVQNALGEEIMFQQVHNFLVNGGENVIVQQTFANGTALSDANSVGQICPFIERNAVFNINDGNTTAIFVAEDQNSGSGNQCLGDTSATFDGSTGGGIMTIGDSAGLAFEGSGGGNAAIGTNEVLTGIGVFTGSGDAAAPTGILFALINTSDVTVAASDTVNISYTFNISDSSF